MAQHISKQQLKFLPCFTHHEDIITLCQPLFKLGISSYHYVRTYADGSEFRLGTHSDWMEHYYSQGLYKESIFEKTPQYYQPGAVLWSTLLSHSSILDSAKNNFNIDHGMTVLNKEHDYCEKIFFGTISTNPGIVNLYLNNRDLLLNFNSYFKEKALVLLHKAKQHRLHLRCNEPLSALQQQDLNMVNCSMKHELKITTACNSLSPREQQIAAFLIKGYTAAAMATELFLSRRTVETHMVNIKEKLKVRNKAQLLHALLSAYQ